MKLTAAQAALLAKLPAFFSVEEDFRASNSPPSIVRNEAGRVLFVFGPGEGKTFGNLWRGGAVVELDRKRHAPMFTQIFFGVAS